jgi:Bacterial regulatory protein, arsR family.
MVIDEKRNISLLKAMGESTRYKILSVLVSGERCACEIPGLIKKVPA